MKKRFGSDNLLKVFLISTFLLLIVTPSFAGNTTKYIGGYGFPSEDYVTKYKINYARVVYTPQPYFTKEVESSNLFITLNIRYRDGEKGERATIPVADYIANAEEALRYSTKAKNIIAISQDDFRDWWAKYAKRDVKILAAISKKINEINPNIMYGATIYENDLDRLSPKEWQEIARHINLVHFYIHQRPSVNEYDRYLNLVKSYFPKAKIILGIYHYDRIAYERRKATSKQEADFFTKQINTCFDKLSDDNVIGIEFYPGRLGKSIDAAIKKEQSTTSRELYNEMKLQMEKKLLKRKP